MTNDPHNTLGDIFGLFLTDDILDFIVTETNAYADRFLNGPNSTVAVREQFKTWTPVDAETIRKFVGLVMVMGIVKKPKISHNWELDPITATPFIKTVMQRRRFQHILKFVHFDSNGPTFDGDGLFKLRLIKQMILGRFTQFYTPGRELAIDEKMMLWRGRLLFRQYIPGKRHKYGIKFYMMCEPTGYVCNFEMYSDPIAPVPGFGLAESVVLRLIESLLDEGRELYIENYYTSYPLAVELLRRQTTVVGTLRKNRHVHFQLSR